MFSILIIIYIYIYIYKYYEKEYYINIYTYIYIYIFILYICMCIFVDGYRAIFPLKNRPQMQKEKLHRACINKSLQGLHVHTSGCSCLGKVNPEVKAAIASGVGATLASVDKVKRSFSCRVLVWATLTHQRASSRISGCSSSNTGCFVVVTARIFRLGIEGQKPDLTFYTLKNVPQQRMT